MNTELLMKNGNFGSAGPQLDKLLFFALLLGTFNLKAQLNYYGYMNYKVISSKECIEYLELHNKSLQDFSKNYHIPSGKGVVYEMFNGEIVLFHPRGKGEYPGFIFANYETFEQCCDADFFPIGEEHMTWLEAHANQMLGFLKDDKFYLEPLTEILKVSTPLRTTAECEDVYERLVNYITNRKNSLVTKQSLVYCYALAICKFLIEEKKYRWSLKKDYEVYNPFYYPEISNEDDRNVDVISKLYIAIGDKHKVSFRDFYWYVTRIPTNIKID